MAINVAVKTKNNEAFPATSRRFQLPDLDRHGGWLIERLVRAFPHRNERELVGWLRGIVYSNEYLFLYREHAVALAVMTRLHALEAAPHLREIFVLAQTGFEVEAAAFYDDFARWATNQGVKVLVIEELTDVPHETIRERVGRVFEKTVKFARM